MDYDEFTHVFTPIEGNNGVLFLVDWSGFVRGKEICENDSGKFFGTGLEYFWNCS